MTPEAVVIGSFLVANPSGRQRDPAVASDGSGYLVAWEDDSTGTVSNIIGNRVNATGVVQGDFFGFPISTATDSQTDAAVTYNGSHLVAWRDRRSGASADVYATRVATDGTVQDASGFAIVASASEEDTPALAPARVGSGLSTTSSAAPVPPASSSASPRSRRVQPVGSGRGRG